MHQWAPEIAVGRGLARDLVRSQFPDVACATLALLGEGWDNTAWLVDRRWVFRFPRRDVAVALMARELAVLPLLASTLPASVPDPAYVGAPSEDYPWPFLGTAAIPGAELGDAALDDVARVPLARGLGSFLRALHRLEVDRLPELPYDPNGRGDSARRVSWARDALGAVSRLGIWSPPPEAWKVLDAAVHLPRADGTVLAHGDLHFRHVLVDPQGRLAGVVDWGDVCLAPPAIDLQLLWSGFTGPARAAFLDRYGPVPAEELLRARVLALGLNAILAAYGHHEGLAAVTREARASLERTATG